MQDSKPAGKAHSRGSRRRRSLRFVRAPRDAAGGLFLIAVAAFALWQGSTLTTGTPRAFGPGMVPQALSVVLAVAGAALFAFACIRDGETLERWSLRGPIFILGAAVIFGLTIRPLGLVVAAPLTIVVGVLASAEHKWIETAVFCVVMTVFCWLLFKVALGLPVPVAPWALGY